MVDCEKGDGIDLAKEFKVRGYPTYVLVNTEGAPIARWAGYTKDYFLETMADAMTDLTTIDDRTARFKDEPDLADALALANYQAEAGDYVQAVDYFTRAGELDPENDYAFDVFENTAGGVRGEFFTYEDAALAAEKVFLSGKAEDMVQAAGMMGSLARRTDKPDDQAKYLKRGIDVVVAVDDDHTLRNQKRLLIDYDLYVTGDSAAAVEFKKSTYPEGWTENPDALNSFAWWCFENLVNLEEAEALSRKAVELSQTGGDRAQILDTAAQICKARGKLDEAIVLMKQAIADDPINDQWKESLAEFESERAGN
jgi:tetratricopeptide (TPR) repeat protein